MNNSNLFRIPMRNIFLIFFTLCLICIFPVFFLLKDLSTKKCLQLLIFFLFNLSLPLLSFWHFGVLSISTEGINLYRVNKLVWADIDEAKNIKIFGLPYVHIKRKKGMNWYVPFYFKGTTSLSEMLLKFVPIDNPLYHVINKKD